MSRPLRPGVGGLLAALAASAALAVGAGSAALGRADRFEHEEHAGLFPVCTGCHVGVEAGDDANSFPEPEVCAACHDGVELDRVGWRAPARPASNVVFEHPTHAEVLARVGEEEAGCEACHSAPDERMRVDGNQTSGACFQCHAHQARAHFEDAACTDCHVPLAESGFDYDRIAALPVPVSHEDAGFLAVRHATLVAEDAADCATCHTQERCTACHVDPSLPAIQRMPPAPDAMRLPPASAAYPVPGTHRDEGFFLEHGRTAGSDSCATCHTSDDCRSCHVSPAPEPVRALASREGTHAPGATLVPRAPASHASPFFPEAHPALAASEAETCATCHTESFCTDCHDGAALSYHPVDFQARHAAEAFGRDTECAACHETAVFCRSCHVDAGLGSRARPGAGYHDAEPLWLLRHGAAARQSLESCASCHEQNQCVQCHGVLGSFKISPHRDDFDARAARRRNPNACRACHLVTRSAAAAETRTRPPASG